MDIPPLNPLDSAHDSHIPLHAIPILPHQLRLPVHPGHLPTVRGEHLRRQQRRPISPGLHGHTGRTTDVRGNRRGWRCKPFGWLDRCLCRVDGWVVLELGEEDEGGE